MSNMKSHYINGQWIQSDGSEFTSTDPATGEMIWKGREADENIVDKAVSAARKAFGTWGQTELKDRIGYLHAFRDKLTKERIHLATAISKENGKPLWDALTEVGAMISKVDISIEAYAVRCQEIKKQQSMGLSVTRHHPHGVMGVLGPFNFPGHIPNGHIVPALLAGNTVVFKPSEITPMTAELTVRYWEECGLPKGVLNLVQGGRKTGEALTQHMLVDGILFTGSWNTGRRLAEMMSKTPYKILALEMGGNNPLIISHVNDIDTAAYLTVMSCFLTSGQRCTCTRRLIVIQDKQNDAFINAFISMVRSFRIGAYTTIPEPFMGPVITAHAAQNLLQAQQKLIGLGGTPLLPLKQLDLGPAFVSPGIIDMTGVRDHPDEEYFGPLLQVYRVGSLDDAIEEANRTEFGLTAGIFTDSEKEYDHFFRRIKAGIVNWNTPLTGASSAAPFGGIGHSGNNRPSAYYAADYCAYPVSSLEAMHITMPAVLPPGLEIPVKDNRI